MVVEVQTRILSGGKEHHVAFLINGGATAEVLLPIPTTRPGSRYHVTGGIVSGISGSFFLVAGDSVHPVNTISIANPTVITTATAHGLTGTFNANIKGRSGASPGFNVIRVGTVTGASTFTMPVNVTAGGTNNTGDLIVEPVSLSSPIEQTIGILFLGTAGPSGQDITPLVLPPNKALILSADSETTQLIGNLTVQEMYPRT